VSKPAFAAVFFVSEVLIEVVIVRPHRSQTSQPRRRNGSSRSPTFEQVVVALVLRAAIAFCTRSKRPAGTAAH